MVCRTPEASHPRRRGQTDTTVSASAGLPPDQGKRGSAGAAGASDAGGSPPKGQGAYPLAECTPVAGAGASATTVKSPGDDGKPLISTVAPAKCWYRAVCSRPEPDGGTITVSCQGDQCRCVFQTLRPESTKTISFDAKDGCQNVRELLRQRCGGGE